MSVRLQINGIIMADKHFHVSSRELVWNVIKINVRFELNCFIFFNLMVTDFCFSKFNNFRQISISSTFSKVSKRIGGFQGDCVS